LYLLGPGLTEHVPSSSVHLQDSLPAAEDLIERHIESSGGREALMRHGSSRIVSTLDVPALDLSGRIVTESAAPNLTSVRTELEGFGSSATGFDGRVAWAMDSSGPRLIEGAEHTVLAESASRLAGLRDASLIRMRETVALRHTASEECYEVRLVWRSGRETSDCYGVATGLRLWTRSQRATPLGSVETLTMFEDYKETQGVLSPRRIRQSMLGMEQLIIVDSVLYDVVEPTAFLLPDAVQALILVERGDPPRP
jgi:hypothetical protein